MVETDDAMAVSEVATAELIAILAHYGQTTQSERMAFLHHPATVAASVPYEYKAVAWLHDVLEDSSFTEGHLRAAGIEESTITAVKLLTRGTNTPYRDYIERIATSGNLAALIVKAADLKHNLRPSCPESLAGRYRLALPRIEAALSEAMREHR